MADWLGKLKDKFTPYAVVASRVAEKKAEETYSPREQHNARGDAYRHLVWQALMARNQSPAKAKLAGDYHESFMPYLLGGGGFDQPSEEKQMDLYNNSLGRRIASQAKSEADIYRLAKEYIDKGIAKYIPVEELEYRANLEEMQAESNPNY